MLQSLHTKFRCLAVILLLTAMTTWAAQVANNQDTVFSRTRDFLAASYPDLAGKNFTLSLKTRQPFDNSWRRFYQIEFETMRYDPLSGIILNPPYDAKSGKRMPPPENAVLKGSALFDSRGWLHAFYAVGDGVHDKHRQELAERVETHPEWSDADATRELKKAGAKYGPDEKFDFRKAMQLENLEPFMGGLELVAVEWDSLPENHEGSFASGALLSSVAVDRLLPGGKRSRYILHFEPFEGRLFSVHKQDERIGTMQEDEY